MGRPEGMLTVEELAALVDTREIDTVLTVFPDLYGRLVGKRIVARFFLDEVRAHGMHACDYLLACDMEMDPVPGYRFASWEEGYGDVRCVPDASTLAPRHLARPHGARPLRRGRREAERPGRRWRRARSSAASSSAPRRPACASMGASELEFFVFRDSYAAAERKRFHDLEPFGWYIEDYHTLQGRKVEPLVGAIRRHLEASGVPVEFSKGEWGPGQHEINLRYADAARDGRPPRDLQAGGEGDRRRAGARGHLHGEARRALGRQLDARPLEPLVRRRHDAALRGRRRAARGLPGARLRPLPLVARRPHDARAGVDAALRALAELLQALSGGLVRADRGSPGRTTTARPAFRVVGHGASLRVECRIPGADANPYLAFAATLAAGLDGIARRIEPPPIFHGDAYAAADLPRVPLSLPEAIAEFEALGALPRGVRRRGGGALACISRAPSSGSSTRW